MSLEDAVGAFLRAQGVHIAEGDGENFLIEEQKGGKGLMLSGSGNLLAGSEMGEEGFDLWRAHGGGVCGSGRSVRTNGGRLSRCGWNSHAGGWRRGCDRPVFSPA